MLSKEVEQYIGKKHMNEADLEALLRILEEDKAKSLTEAILILDEEKKEP